MHLFITFDNDEGPPFRHDNILIHSTRVSEQYRNCVFWSVFGSSKPARQESRVSVTSVKSFNSSLDNFGDRRRSFCSKSSMVQTLKSLLLDARSGSLSAISLFQACDSSGGQPLRGPAYFLYLLLPVSVGCSCSCQRTERSSFKLCHFPCKMSETTGSGRHNKGMSSISPSVWTTLGRHV